jgi:hypothetical protein
MDGERLARQGDDVLSLHLHAFSGDPPLSTHQVDLAPLGLAQLARTDEREGRQPEGTLGHEGTPVAFDRAQQGPRRSAAGSRAARPVAMAYRNTRPQFWCARCAVSIAPRASMRRRTSKRSGAVISPTGRAPSHGKMSRSKRPLMLLVCPGAQRGACFASHSHATASKLPASRSA